jgi:hypothetical protein
VGAKITGNCGQVVDGECIILEDALREQRTEDCVKNPRIAPAADRGLCAEKTE